MATVFATESLTLKTSDNKSKIMDFLQDVTSEQFDYWINFYSVIFTLLILSLSINLSFFIKNIWNRILSILVMNGIFSLILDYFFAIPQVGYHEQRIFYVFIYKGYNQNLFGSFFYCDQCIHCPTHSLTSIFFTMAKASPCIKSLNFHSLSVC